MRLFYHMTFDRTPGRAEEDFQIIHFSYSQCFKFISTRWPLDPRRRPLFLVLGQLGVVTSAIMVSVRFSALRRWLGYVTVVFYHVKNGKFNDRIAWSHQIHPRKRPHSVRFIKSNNLSDFIMPSLFEPRYSC